MCFLLTTLIQYLSISLKLDQWLLKPSIFWAHLISLHLHQHLFSFFFAIIVILTGTNRYLIMILVCISLVINGVKTSFHVFVGYLYFSFGEIFNQVFCPFLICLCVIELLDTRFLSDMIASIFSNLLSLSLS